MSDDNVSIDISDGETIQEDTPSDTPNTYCTQDDVNSMFGDISDDISEEMFNTAIANATTWIEANLKRNYVPIPTTNVNALKTVAIYHSASDILLSLYQGTDELPVQYDVWFNKAQSLLEDYIDAYLNSDAADAETTDAYLRVKHRHGLTYNQKRGRGHRWRR